MCHFKDYDVNFSLKKYQIFLQGFIDENLTGKSIFWGAKFAPLYLYGLLLVKEQVVCKI